MAGNKKSALSEQIVLNCTFSCHWPGTFKVTVFECVYFICNRAYKCTFNNELKYKFKPWLPFKLKF